MDEELVTELVEELYNWLIDYADAIADGDEDPNDLLDMVHILQKFPVNLEITEDIWQY